MSTPRAAASLVILAIAVGACSSARPVPAASMPPARSSVPAREPADLARLPQEQVVLDAFAAGGLAVTVVGGSKSEGQLGRVLPARVFIASQAPTHGGFGEGADVLLLPVDARWAIRVCETPSPEVPRVLYEFHVNGQRVGGSDAARPIHHLVNDRFFVIAYTDRSAEALQRGLGLSPAAC